MILYGYWRSTAAYRVRIALNLKGIVWKDVSVHLVKDGGEQFTDQYIGMNPNSLVPTLELENGETITQSLAIIDYLEEAFPNDALYPNDLLMKSKVKSMAMDIACDVHPLNNLRVLKKLKSLELSQDQVDDWYHHWIHKGFAAIEKNLKKHSGDYCFGDRVTVADICLVAQVYNANRFKVDLNEYPLIRQINQNCLKLPAFDLAKPENQPDSV